MGCATSSSRGPDFSEDVGPDGPLSDALQQLIVSGHVDRAYNGLFTRGPIDWNGKAMYTNGARFIYYYAQNEGGGAGWNFDHRDQPQTQGARDWCAAGYASLRGGPAYPPLGHVTLEDIDDEEVEDVTVVIMEVEPVAPPAMLTISGHSSEEANGPYSLAADLWNR